MFNEKATVSLLHLFDFRVSFIKTVQPAGLTASGFSLLPAAPWERLLRASLPPSLPSRLLSRHSWASWGGPRAAHSPPGQDCPVAPGLVPSSAPLPSTTSRLATCKSLSSPLPSVAHDPEASFPPRGFQKPVGAVWGL